MNPSPAPPPGFFEINGTFVRASAVEAYSLAGVQLASGELIPLPPKVTPDALHDRVAQAEAAGHVLDYARSVALRRFRYNSVTSVVPAVLRAGGDIDALLRLSDADDDDPAPAEAPVDQAPQTVDDQGAADAGPPEGEDPQVPSAVGTLDASVQS